jgi:hypothetical protein
MRPSQTSLSTNRTYSRCTNSYYIEQYLIYQGDIKYSFQYTNSCHFEQDLIYQGNIKYASLSYMYSNVYNLNCYQPASQLKPWGSIPVSHSLFSGFGLHSYSINASLEVQNDY